MRNKRSLLGGSALLAAVVFCFLCGTARSEGLEGEKFKLGDRAPEFATRDIAGNDVALSGLAGKTVLLLNFWGLRCGACLEEMPYLEALSKKYAAKGVLVWGVDTDGVDAQTVKDTLKTVGVSVSYPLLVDPEFKITDVYTNFLVPLTLVIDRKGTVQYIHTGFEAGLEKDYEAAVLKALGS